MTENMTPPEPILSTPDVDIPIPSTPDVKVAPTSGVNVLLVIVLLVSLGLAGFMWWQNQQLQKQIAEIKQGEEQKTTENTAIPTITPDPTEGWKIYTNEQFGFSFKYPSTWSDETDLNTVKQGNRNFILKTDNNEFVSGVVFDKEDKAFVEEAWSKQVGLNSGKALIISYTDNIGPGSKGGERDLERFNQILTSIKTDNKIVATKSEWVEGEMEATGVSFQYPNTWNLGRIETGNRIEGEKGCAMIDIDEPVATTESLTTYAAKTLMVDDLTQVLSQTPQMKIGGKETINLGAQGIGEKIWFMVKRDANTIQSIHLFTMAPEGMPMEEWEKHVCYSANMVEAKLAEEIIQTIEFN